MKKILLLTLTLLELGFLSAQITIQNEVLSSAGTTFSFGSYEIDFTLGEVFTTTLSTSNGTVYTQGFQQPMRKKIAVLEPVLVSLEEEVSESFSVYPNPFRGDLTIEIPESSSVTFQLFDNSGRLILVDQLSQVVNTIDLSILAVGNYQLVLQTNEALLGRISIIKSH
jgi:hypothetical protein